MPEPSRVAAAVLLALLAAAVPPARAAAALSQDAAAAAAPAIEPRAEAALRRMSDRLAAAGRFRVTADEVRDVVDAGETKQVRLSRTLAVERPDRLRADFTLEDGGRSVWYERGLLSVSGDARQFYAQADVPPTLDEALDFVAQRLDLRMPMADLLYAVPYDAYVGESSTGRWVGLETVDGVPCDRLEFRHPVVAFEIWIAAEGEPLPRRLELVYLQDEGAPRSRLELRDWDLTPTFAADTFTFTPAEGAVRVPFRGQRRGATAAAEPAAAGAAQ